MKKISITVLSMILLTVCLLFTACKSDFDLEEWINSEGNTVKVTINCMDGETPDSSTSIDYRVKPGSPIPNPGVTENTTAPTREGYILEGYYLGTEDGNGVTYGSRWDFATGRANEDLTLYCKWEVQFVIRIVHVIDGVAQEDSYTDVDVLNNQPEVTSLPNPMWTNHTYLGSVYTSETCNEEDLLTVSNDNPFVHGCTADNPVREVYAPFIEGNWTLVRTAKDMRTVSPGSSLYLLADIDFADMTDEDGYTSVSITSSIFSGKINGNGHTISNLNYFVEGARTAGTDSFGLFSRLKGAEIKDVVFKDCSVSVRINRTANEYFVGFLAGQCDETTILTNVTFDNVTVKSVEFSFARDDESKAEEMEKTVLGEIFGQDERNV